VNKKRSPQSDLGILGLLLALIVLGAAAQFLADANGLKYENLGTLIWMTITAVSFILGLLYFAQFVLPQRDQEGWAEGLRLLGRFYLSSGQRYVSSATRGGARSQGRRRRKKKGEGGMGETAVIPPSFNAVQAGVVRGEYAITINKGTHFIRPGGPGFVMLFRGEKVDQIIDLRPQKRSQPVTATTRDGIPVDTSASVTFRVRQAVPRNHSDPLVHAYDRDVLFAVSNFTRIDQDGNKLPWTEQLALMAAAELSDELSTYLIDELQQSNARFSVRSEISQRIHRKLAQKAEVNGIELQSVGIGPITVPKEILDQRIKTWQAEWQRKITERHAKGDAEAIQQIKKARARAQIEIIEKITQSIESMRYRENSNLTEIITLRMIEALEEATTHSSVQVQGLVPQQVMANLVLDASNQMQLWMQRQAEDEA
jgi:regulator of protease activity HflC (stomatin/prohibitin superfamily)